MNYLFKSDNRIRAQGGYVPNDPLKLWRMTDVVLIATHEGLLWQYGHELPFSENAYYAPIISNTMLLTSVPAFKVLNESMRRHILSAYINNMLDTWCYDVNVIRVHIGSRLSKQRPVVQSLSSSSVDLYQLVKAFDRWSDTMESLLGTEPEDVPYYNDGWDSEMGLQYDTYHNGREYKSGILDAFDGDFDAYDHWRDA